MTGPRNRDIFHSNGFARQACVSIRHLIRLLALVLSTGLLASRLDAAPPDFACGGLAPDDATLHVRFDPDRPHARAWFDRIEDIAAGALGEESATQLRSIHAFGQRLSGSESAESVLIVRAESGRGMQEWVMATRLFDREACARGLREAEARVMGGGRFSLPESELEIRPLRNWLLAGPMDVRLLDDVEERAAIDDVESRESSYAELVASLPRAAVEIVYRHPSPVDGRTAASVKPTSEDDAEITLSGRYAASPLPVRRRSRVDLRMLSVLGRRGAIAMHESGIGILDPLLIQLSAGIPELMPPAEIRRLLDSERIVVLDGETLKIEGRGLFEVPAVCVAIPYRSSDPAGPTVDEATGLLDDWMMAVGSIVRGDLRTPGEPGDSDGLQVGHGGVRHLDLGSALGDAVGGHPVGLASSLNWSTCLGSAGRHWFVVATTPDMVGLVGRALADGESLEGEQATSSCSAGVVRPEALALQVEDLARIRSEQGDGSADSDAAMMNALARLLGGFRLLEWRMDRQDADAIEGRARVQVTPVLTDGAMAP